ncbi:MAG: ATP-binding protein [Pseudomonadota bacterium]
MRLARQRPHDGSLRQEVQRLLIEQSISAAWVLIYLNVLLAVFFGVVYLTSLRDPAVVLAVLWPRLLASALAGTLILILSVKGRDWVWQQRRQAVTLLTFHEFSILCTFGVTATFWMSEQDYSTNALTVTGICAFGIISGILAPRHRVALISGRLGLFLPLIWFCISTQPPLWKVLASLCMCALIASYGVAFAVHGQQRKQALLAARLRRARRSATRALRAERRIRAELEAENALRERFLHAITHDLGQPLQALNFHLHRLEHAGAETSDRDAADRVRQFVDVAKVCLVSANGIIDSVAGSAWLHRKLAPADCKPVPLTPLFAAVAAEIEPLVEHHDLVLTVVPTSLCVVAEADFLERIIRNLVRNAVQHSEHRILIGARRRGTELVEVLVQDDGPGVPADMREVIFQPFQQAQITGRRGGGNVGLGLSIVDELTTHMGGHVELITEDGRGSRFSCVLKRAQLPAGQPSANSASLFLIIDDNPIQSEATKAAVLTAGATARPFDKPLRTETIIAAIRDHAQPVLLDYHLGDGQTADAVLDALSLDELALVHVMTSDQSPDLSRAVRARGVAMIIKPVRADHIKAILA